MRAITDFDTKSRPARAYLIMVVLTTFTVFCTLYGWFRSIDVRGWWPVILSICFAVTFVYALLYALLVNHHRLNCPSFLVWYHVALGTVLSAYTYLYYAIVIDWNTVNDGFAHLSIVQKIVKNDKTYYAIHLLFLCAAVIWSFVARLFDAIHSQQSSD